MVAGVATALTEMGRYSEAATYFERAAKINNMPQFYMNAGMTYERMNDWSSAMSAYKACLDLSKQQFKPCHIKLAGIQNHLGDFMAVQWHLQMAIQLDPSDFQAYTYLGDVYNNLKQVLCVVLAVFSSLYIMFMFSFLWQLILTTSPSNMQGP